LVGVEKLESIRSGELSAEENVETLLERVEEEDLNAYIEVNPLALEEARKVDREVKKGEGGRLSGLGIAVKSNINVKGLKATCASKTLENYTSPYSATVVERIRKEGGVVLGMTNMDEFACGSSGESSYFGATINPSARDRVPGGSSSGSASAVAGGLSDMALGSDTGGSIRNPASHCGAVGLKPTYGLVPRQGLIDLAMSFDQIGPLARDVRSAASLLEVIGGYNPREAVSRSVPPPQYISNLSSDLEGQRIGFAREFQEVADRRIVARVKEGIGAMESHGAEVVEVSLPHLEAALSAYYLIVFVEFFSATRKYDGRRFGNKIEEVCGEEVLRRILTGKYISQKEYTGRYYKKALQFRSLINREIVEALNEVDLIAGPTTPRLPHRQGEEIEPLDMYSYDLLTVPANLAGIPAGVINTGNVGGVPVGLQLQARPLEEQKIFNAMLAVEGGR